MSSENIKQMQSHIVTMRNNLASNPTIGQAVPSMPGAPANSSTMMHSLIYGLNVYQELNALRAQYRDNKHKVFYFSKAIGNIQLFIEFFFEILNEKAEPLIALVEFIKAILKFREYRLLVGSEKLNTYIEMESYHELKRIKEIKDKHFQLVRSKKTLPRLRQFKPSARLEQLKKMSSAPPLSYSNLQGNTGAQVMVGQDIINIGGMGNGTSSEAEL